jgi:hypothetical protein
VTPENRDREEVTIIKEYKELPMCIEYEFPFKPTKTSSKPVEKDKHKNDSNKIASKIEEQSDNTILDGDTIKKSLIPLSF